MHRLRACEACGSAFAEDQRYCLLCGQRAGPPPTGLEGLLRRLRRHYEPAVIAPADDAPADNAPAAHAPADAPAAHAPAAGERLGRRPHMGLLLASTRASTLLVAVFLAFGVLLGHVASSGRAGTLASARSPLRIVRVTPRSSATPGTGAPAVSTPAEEAPAETPTVTEATPAGKPSSTAKAPSETASGSPASREAASEEGSKEGSASKEASKPAGPAKKLPSVKHVFVIMLSNEPYASVFGPSSTSAYLSHTLEHDGELLVRFDAVAHDELADEIALLSGQGPTAETASNCPTYTEIQPTGTGADEQVLGDGCVYPSSTPTLAGELSSRHLSWRAYVQGIDEPGFTAMACAHPALGQADPSSADSSSTGPYATFRNPFVYFASVVDSAQCATDDVGLGALKGDLASATLTPSFSYIVPDRCHDGNPTPCTPGAPAGLAAADTFLQQVVPEIMASPAYKQNGLLVITVDEAPSSGPFADSSSCCGQPLFPNAPEKSAFGAARGGGAVGALLLSPFVAAGTTNQNPFNDFSLLRTIDAFFGVKPLGYAGLATVKPFEPAMFTTR